MFKGLLVTVLNLILGALYDAIGNYDSGFYFAGLMIFISGVMLFALPAMQKKRAKKASRASNANNGAK